MGCASSNNVPLTSLDNSRTPHESGKPSPAKNRNVTESKRDSREFSDLNKNNKMEMNDNKPSEPSLNKEPATEEPRELASDTGKTDNAENKVPNDSKFPNASNPASENMYSASVELPEDKVPAIPVDFPFLKSFGKSKWPIRCFGPLDFNINAGHGGCVGLAQISNSYGGPGCDTNCQVLLVRCGFNSNFIQCTSLIKSHAGHFGASNGFETDEKGRLITDCLFGANHVSFISNNSRYGNLSHGVYARGPEDGSTGATLPLNVNGGRQEYGSGCTLVLCGGWESGVDEASHVAALYMLRSGYKDNVIQKSLMHGDDKWTFACNDDGVLTVTGPNRASYGLYHNRGNIDQGDGTCGAWHRSTANGACPISLVDGVACSSVAGIFAVLCSHSSGEEDRTSAAMYIVIVADGKVQAKMYSGSTGKLYQHSSADLWEFKLSNSELLCTGPTGPCRYAVMSNVLAPSTSVPKALDHVDGSYVVAKDPIKGAVEISENQVVGWISQRKDVVILVNKSLRHTLLGSSLVEKDGKFVFFHTWSKEEQVTGLYLVNVCCITMDKVGHEVKLDIEGSPRQLVYQPRGVVYALNVCGPAYQATNDIVYTSEFSQFANFDPDQLFGGRCRALGGKKHPASHPAVVSGTLDGPLYVTARSTGIEPEDEQKLSYDIEDLPNGSFTLRIHSVFASPPSTIIVNGDNVKQKMAQQLSKQKEVLAGCSAHCVDVPVKITNHRLEIRILDYKLGGLALLDKTYKEKSLTDTQQQEERDQRSKLIDSVEPLGRQLTRKERKIIGWSPNLLNNASGQAGNMSHWNIAGDWKVIEGGYGTEKAFTTSHMKCVKYQEVDLTEHFSEEHLDTGPQIQISEWYKEGVGGGGFYSFTASIMSADGTVIDSYDSGTIGRIYRDHKWSEETVTFKGYGPGVRTVSLESTGKDDKFWGGHYGAIMSNAIIRVKNPTDPPENDLYQDIISEQDLDQTSDANIMKRDKLVASVMTNNRELLEELAAEEAVPVVDQTIMKHFDSATKTSAPAQRRARKKREIRCFMSSTFRDFKEEREQLIKKTFREINGLCSDRGVFFTYVDLRWGITEEQTNHGQTISICLQEISRCRPYFICMMGERFGWSQKEDKADKVLNESFDYAIKNFPKDMGWLEDYRYNTSVTQLEILHGVLNDVQKYHERSFFYLRDPVQKDVVDEATFKIMTSESEWHHEKQLAMRERIRSLSELTVKSYRKVDTVCDMIKKDLESCIERDFPRGTELTPLEQEREAHLAFAEARQRVYIGRGEYFGQITDSLEKNPRQPLVILGESGSGKSALVANWVGRVEEKNPAAFVFFHFIGSSAQSVSYIKLLRRLCEELRAYFHIDLPVPASDSHLLRDVPTWLRVAGARGQCYIILDALNQLDDGSGTEGSEHDLQWLPSVLPPGVKMLLSTLPGKALDAVRSLSWPVMMVEPLQSSEKLQILEGYLEGIYGKTLSEDQKTMIVGAEQTNNPLYLRSLLDEVRVFGNFRKLTEKIADYLTADKPRDLFAKILERLEGDFEQGHHQRPGLVRDTTIAIWCSHRGMSEAELLDLLQVPSAVWSPFYLSLIENLVNRNGIVNFFHDHLRHAVEDKYLSTEAAKLAGYRGLAQYFSQRDMDDRKCDELPMLLAKSGQMDALRAFISDLEVFRRLAGSEEGKFDLIKFWKMLGDYSEVEAAYTSALAAVPDTDTHTDTQLQIQRGLSEFFSDLGLYEGARSLGESLLSHLETKYGDDHSAILYDPMSQSYRHRCNHPTVIEMHITLGSICLKQKTLDEAEDYYKEAIARLDRVTTPKQKLQTTESLLGWSAVLSYKDNMTEAKKYLIRARELATDVLGSKHHYVAAITNNLGQQCYKQGRLEEALGYFLQDLALTRSEVGTSHPRVAGVLNEAALVYDDRHDPLAGELYEAALVMLLDTYGNSHLDVAVVRYNLGMFYFAASSFSRARYQLEQAVKIYSSFLGDDHGDTANAREALRDVTGAIE